MKIVNDETGKLAIYIKPVGDIPQGLVYVGFIVERKLEITTTRELYYSKETFLKLVDVLEKEGYVTETEAGWFRENINQVEGLLETEAEVVDRWVRFRTGETGPNPAGVERVEENPDFYVIWTSTGNKSREFCNLDHAMKSVAKMLADRLIPTQEETWQIQDRILNLCLPVNIRDAVSRRTGIDPGKSEFVTGVEVKGDKARLVPPCGAKLPWLKSREALSSMLRMFGPEALKGGRAEFDHVEKQINLVPNFREHLTDQDRIDLEKFSDLLIQTKVSMILGQIFKT